MCWCVCVVCVCVCVCVCITQKQEWARQVVREVSGIKVVPYYGLFRFYGSELAGLAHHQEERRGEVGEGGGIRVMR